MPDDDKGRPPPAATVTPPALRALAARHGFDDVRVTDAAPHAAAAAHFAGWLARDYQADMTWIGRDPERRSEPARLVPRARSVITLAVNYYRERGEPGPGAARVSRYAAGVDYHRTIERGMRALIAELRQTLAGAFRYYVDYGPVLERAFAERAGLGFIGRSANLIHPRFGTYVFLATIVTDAVLPVSEPGHGTCGQCRRCIDVCPTGALKHPFEIDAALCISYLTIENRGPIPRRLRPLIGSWLFGCDLCQEVCPYNRRAEPGANAAIARESIAGTELDVAEVLAIRDDAGFARRFARSPVRRAKRAGLLRNAAVVAGNLLHAPLVAPLQAAAALDASPLVRGHAIWALGRYGERRFIATRAEIESDAFAREEIRTALGAG